MASVEVKKPKKVKFIFNKGEDLEPFYVNGIYGGVTPRGDLLCHLFYEYLDLPITESSDVAEDGQMIQETIKKQYKVEGSPDEIVFKRDVKASVIIPIHQVESFANWMMDKVKNFEQAQKKFEKLEE